MPGPDREATAIMCINLSNRTLFPFPFQIYYNIKVTNGRKSAVVLFYLGEQNRIW